MAYIRKEGRRYRLRCPLCDKETVRATNKGIRCRTCGYRGKLGEFLEELEEIEND